MPEKLRMPTSLEAVFECEVKNPGDDRVKVTWLRADQYEHLSKEMEIKILSTIKPEGVTWQQHQAAEDSETESQTPEPEPEPEVEVTSDTPEAEEALSIDPEEVIAEIPSPPPPQDYNMQPGEDEHAFRGRRMREGKALAQWERTYDLKAEDYDDYVKQQIETASLEALQNK